MMKKYTKDQATQMIEDMVIQELNKFNQLSGFKIKYEFDKNRTILAEYVGNTFVLLPMLSFI